MTRERPILFSGPLVRAILDGRKTQTRRVLTLRGGGLPGHREDARFRLLSGGRWHPCVDEVGGGILPLGGGEICPYGQVGDRLWVRETWGLHRYSDITDWRRDSIRGEDADAIRATWETSYLADWVGEPSAAFWRPSIHMPRWASRLTLRITDVRVERLKDISEEGAIAEGAVQGEHTDGPRWHMDPTVAALGREHCLGTARMAFGNAWNSLYGLGAWDANPWVWALTFKREGGAA